MTASFSISGTLPGLNEIVNIARSNRFAGASQKKKETRRCMMAVIAGKVPLLTVPVRVHFAWIEKDYRRDPDNICAGAKFILDALVEMKRIPNDTRKYIWGLSHEFMEPNKKDPKVLVTISTLEEQKCL